MENSVKRKKRSSCQLCQHELSPHGVYFELKSVVENRKLSMIKHILTRHLNFNIAKHTDARTLIHGAFEQTDKIDQMQAPIIETLKLLMQSGADINVKNKREHTVLHLAVVHRLTYVIDFLISCGADLHVCSDTGDSILHFLIQTEYQKFKIISTTYKDYAKCVQQLEAQCVEFIRWMIPKGLDVDCKNEDGDTALHLAVKTKSLHLLPLLLEHTKKADVFNIHSMTAFQVFALLASSLDDNSETRVNEIYEKFLSKGFSVDVTDGSGCTPLHHALNQGRLSIVESMLKNFTYVNVRDEHQDTVLHIVINRLTKDLAESEVVLYHEIAHTLITKGANVHQKNNDGISPLIAVVLNQKTSLLELFAEYVSNIHDTYKGKNLLHLFCSLTLNKGSREYRRALDLLCEKVDDINAKDHEGRTPLHYAARCSTTQTTKKLIARGADILSRSNSGSTPLHEAVEGGRKDTMTLLIAKGADVNAKDANGKVPLHFAARSNECELVEALLRSGAEVNVNDKVSGYTPLHEAINYNRDKSAIMLIENGADVNATDNTGKTSLHHAVQYSEPELVETLLTYGANFNAKEHVQGYTSLHVAVECCREKSTMLLIEVGADVNARSKVGRTPLHLVADESEFALVKLIEFGAHVDVADDYGCLPLHMAILRHNVQGVKKLLAFGADINDNVDVLSVDDYKSLGTCIFEHLIKLKAAGLRIEKKLEIAFELEFNAEIHESCAKEIEMLKSCKIRGSTSLYDLLHVDRNSASNYVEDEELKKLMSSLTFATRFPTYHTLISAAYYKGVERRKMLEPARNALHKLANVQLPVSCLHEIVGYLNNVSFRSLIEAATMR